MFYSPFQGMISQNKFALQFTDAVETVKENLTFFVIYYVNISR